MSPSIEGVWKTSASNSSIPFHFMSLALSLIFLAGSCPWPGLYEQQPQKDTGSSLQDVTTICVCRTYLKQRGLDARSHKVKNPQKSRLRKSFLPNLQAFCPFNYFVDCHHGGHRLWLLPCSHLLLHVHRLLTVLLQQEDVFFCHALCDGRDWTWQRGLR